MTLFWITAALLLGLGYLLFVPALLGKTRRDSLNRARLNLVLHRQRQEELASDASSEEARHRLAVESERSLLGDLETAADGTAAPLKAGRTPLLAALTLAPILAIGAYLWLGRPDLVAAPPPANPMADTQKAIEGLALRLQENPNDLEGWVLLGRSLQATQQAERAVRAFEFALKLAPRNLDLKGYYAEALAEANQGSMRGKPAEIVAEILRQDPRHKAGLWLAGIVASEEGDGARAVRHWQALRSQFPADSEEARQIGAFIEQAGSAAPADAMPPAASEPAATAPRKRLSVRVTLADALKSRANPDDTVFVFARAAEGPPMPLAVVRKQVRDLPLDVVLDDSQAMMPGMNLSAFERLVIGARISKSGRPVPSPGDLEGLTGPVTPAPGQTVHYDVAIGQIVNDSAP